MAPHAHGHSHGHGHGHGHGHEHSHDLSGRRIGWAFVLNLVFTIIELIGGLLTNSTAILADAVHDLGDTISIGLGWVLNRRSGQAADQRYTYGYYRLTLAGAFINASVLVGGSLWVLSEAVPRLFDPQMPDAVGMTWLAILGIAVNGLAAYTLSGGKTLNEQVLNWHLLEDVLGWVAVLVVSVVLMFVDWPILDPLLSIGFTLFILYNVVRNLRSTLRLFLQGAPEDGLAPAVREQLLAIDHVADVHHLHIWSLDGERHVLSAHLVLDKPLTGDIHRAVKAAVQQACEAAAFAHTTIEIEAPDEPCRDGHGEPG